MKIDTFAQMPGHLNCRKLWQLLKYLKNPQHVLKAGMGEKEKHLKPDYLINRSSSFISPVAMAALKVLVGNWR
jgi:hypothetical protein